MKLNKILFLVLVLSILLVAFAFFSPALTLAPGNYQNSNTNQGPFVVIRNTKLEITIVTTNVQRALGLAKRDSLPENQGMLFDFNDDKNSKPGFWMKDMKFDIDIIWIKDDKVLFIHKNVSAPETPSSPLSHYYPPSSVDYVLETNAGWSEKNKIAIVD